MSKGSRHPIDVGHGVSVLVNGTVAMFYKIGEKKDKERKSPTVVKRKKCKIVPETKKGTTCCGVYHNCDEKYLHHFIKKHLEKELPVCLPDLKKASKLTSPFTPPSPRDEPVTPLSATDKPVTPLSHTDKPVTPLSATDKPVTPLSATDKPVTPLSATDKPVTPLSHTDKPVTPLSATDKPVTPLSATDKPVTPLSATDKPVTPLSATDKPVTPLSHTDTPVTPLSPTDKPVTPLSHTDKPVTPLSATDKPVTPLSHTDKPVTPLSATDKPVTPLSATDKPVTPLSATDKPVTPLSHTDKPVTPLSATNKPVTPLSATDKPVTPLSATDKPVTPLSHTDKPVTPLSHTDKPVTPLSATNKPVTPLSATDKPVTPLSATDKPVTPLSHTDKPVTPLSHTDKPVTPLSATDKPVTPLSHTNKPVTPLSATDKPVTPLSATDKPVTPLSHTDKPVAPLSHTDTPVTPLSPTDKPVTPLSPTNTPVTPLSHTDKPVTPLSHTNYHCTPTSKPPKHQPAISTLILCCGDVEQNPGPSFECLHEKCSSTKLMYSSMQDLAKHITTVHIFDFLCTWDGCVYGMLESDAREMETHMLSRHLYMTHIFENFEEWCGALPSGYVDFSTTDLRLCPPALRCNFDQLLLDETFDIRKRYTVLDHQMYLYHLQRNHPDQYFERVESFISRQPPGKWEFNGNQCIRSNNQYQAKKTSESHTQSDPLIIRDVYCVRQPANTDNTEIVTSRPELVGKSKSVRYNIHDPTNTVKKIKTQHNSTSTNSSIDCPWKHTLMTNLGNCKSAMVTEFKILEDLQGKLFITKENKFLLDAEDFTVRIATSPGSSEGVFMCNVFKVQIDGRQIYYARFIESGCYTHFMTQVGKDCLLEALDTSSEFLFLHQVLSQSDIQNLIFKKESHRESKGKKGRADKNYKNSLKNIKQILANSVSLAHDCDVDFTFNFLHCVRKGFHAEVESTFSDDWFLHSNLNDNLRSHWQRKLQSFPLEKVIEPLKLSEQFSIAIIPPSATLLSQSIFLNYLSNSHLLSGEKTRFYERFPTSKLTPKSFRNKIIWHFLRNETGQLLKLFETCRKSADVQHLTNVDDAFIPSNSLKNVSQVPHVSRKRKCIATVDAVTGHLGNAPFENLANMCRIFDSYIRNVIQSGSLYFHTNTEDKLIVIMNDYNAENGTFRDYDYVHTSREITEEGFMFRCSCRIYKTLLECARGEDVLQYDSLDISTGIKCMHCRFLKDYIIPFLNDPSKDETQLSVKVAEGLTFCEKSFVQLTGKNNTKKFSISNEPHDDPSFVHITFNGSTGKYVISCLDGYCKSVRGSKRNIDHFDDSGTLCKHLKVIHESQEWMEFKTENSTEDTESDPLMSLDNDDTIPEVELDIASELLSDPSDDHVFDVASGLWKFPCKSSHAAKLEFSEELASAVQTRDILNDNNTECVPRSDGCLKGPMLVSKIPATHCPCGIGWTNTDYPEGRTELRRRLTIYTEIAPVSCSVHTRLCVASVCRLEWDEGKELCLHVYSSETAAGDEIGWMFVNQVLGSKITFSGFCKNMSSTYKRRCVTSRGFMDPGVFLKWWFSWASNMKIDFRKPCPVCKFTPSQLACDGTKIGIGFRNANFDPIEISNGDTIHETLHRRIDRCFITHSVDTPTQILMICREHMLYLGSVASDDKYLKDDNLTEVIINERTEVLYTIFPVEALQSLRRFLAEMPEVEKVAYGKLLIMLSTTAPLSTIIPYNIVPELRQLLACITGETPHDNGDQFYNSIMHKLRFYCPEIRSLIANSMFCNFDTNGGNVLPGDIVSLIKYILNRVSSLEVHHAEQASEQIGTYNPPKYGRAYYFSPNGCAIRNLRKFAIDEGKTSRNTVADDNPMAFETCNKLFSKVQVSARGSTSLFLWFCPSHGHCYGFHMAYAEGRKDPYASIYRHLEVPPDEIFYDFACNLQEYCLNRESGYFQSVRFFHDIFHGYSHKCSRGYRSSRLLGFDTINSEICEQFNSFIQCIKSAARQMNQTHFCFYLQFFLHIWNQQKHDRYRKRLMVALAGSD